MKRVETLYFLSKSINSAPFWMKTVPNMWFLKAVQETMSETFKTKPPLSPLKTTDIYWTTSKRLSFFLSFLLPKELDSPCCTR